MSNLMDKAIKAANPAFMAAFGEPATYYPRGGVSREIVGIVDRDVPMRIRAMPGLQQTRVLFSVPNDPAVGIASDKLDLGGDYIGVPVRMGQAPERLRILPQGNPITQDAGMIQLALA